MRDLLDGRVLLAAVLAGFVVARLVALVVRPPARLAHRVRPYTIASRTELGGSPDVLAVAEPGTMLNDSTLVRLFEPLVQLLTSAAAATAFGLVIGLLIGQSAAVMLFLGGVGLIFGLSWPRGRLDRVIQQRREIMRVELYTINHLLAMNIRVGGGVIQAVQ